MTVAPASTTTTWPAAESSWDGTIDRLPANRPLSQGERMREWLHLFRECREAAEILARTSFVPKDMMGKPAEIATSMLKGWELGLDPLDALASIYVVHGRVGFYAEFMRRRMIQAGHVFRVVESNDSRCIVEGTRCDNGETHRAVFTAEQAKRAKIDIAAYPAEKLVARATSRLVKQAFPDVLSGSLIVEDLLDGITVVESERVDAPAAQVAATPAVQRKPRAPRAAKAQPAATRPAASGVLDDLLDDPAPPPAEARPVPDEPAVAGEPEGPPSQAQNRKMHALFRDAEISDRDDRLALTSEIVGFTIRSSSELTKSDATKVIDTMELWASTPDETGTVPADALIVRANDVLNAAALREAETNESATNEED